MRADDTHHPFIDVVEGEEVAQSNSGESALVEAQVAELVGDALYIDRVESPRSPATEGIVVLHGRLQRPSADVFPIWLRELGARNYTPVLRDDESAVTPLARLTADEPAAATPGMPVQLRIFRALPKRLPGSIAINVTLYLLTWISTLYVGAAYVNPEMMTDLFNAELLRPAILFTGLPFALTLMSILTAHEFGHYFVARIHKVDVTLPYFIPMPFVFGTMGAFIMMREAISDRRKLFDIGVAGPLAGLVFAVPLLFYGLSTSVLTHLPDTGVMIEGNSLLYLFAKYITFGMILPDHATRQDVMMNAVTFGAWVGLLVTAINLMPVGQLDGGHTIYAMLGKRARTVNVATLVIMALLGIAGVAIVQEYLPFLAEVGSIGWFVWILLILYMIGPFHPPPLDDVTTIGKWRWVVGIFVFLIFLLIFAPATMRAI